MTRSPPRATRLAVALVTRVSACGAAAAQTTPADALSRALAGTASAPYHATFDASADVRAVDMVGMSRRTSADARGFAWVQDGANARVDVDDVGASTPAAFHFRADETYTRGSAVLGPRVWRPREDAGAGGARCCCCCRPTPSASGRATCATSATPRTWAATPAMASGGATCGRACPRTSPRRRSTRSWAGSASTATSARRR